MGPTPCYSQSQVVPVCQSFRLVAQQFFFSGKSTNFCCFSFFKGIEKGCGHMDVLITFPSETESKYIYIYIWIYGLTSIAQA